MTIRFRLTNRRQVGSKRTLPVGSRGGRRDGNGEERFPLQGDALPLRESGRRMVRLTSR